MAALVAAALLAAAGLYFWLRTGLPQTEGIIAVPGLSRPVEIARDPSGIPAIAAESETDAAFALGFVHAQDRLWQMDAMRRLGAGRLSEVSGERAFELDRFMRTLGLYRLAEASYAILAPEVRASLDAYAAGVNAYLATRRGALPPEFVLLRYAPEPWRPADSLVWGKLMAMQLSADWRAELLRLRLSKRLDAEAIEALWPSDGFAPPTTLANGIAGARSGASWALSRPLAALFQGAASNAWAVAGPLTLTAAPVLANDPHLGAQLPSQWYLARLSAPGLDVAGATAPGVPFVILGQNATLAWGFTSSQADVEDVVIERVRDGRYAAPDGEHPIETREETIRTKGGPDRTIRVRRTANGPVISDALAKKDEVALDDGTALALAAPYLREPDRTANAIYRMNRAEDGAALDAALDEFEALQQFVLYAEASGGIGFLAPGRVPMRREGDGFWPADGATGRGLWTGFIPYEDLPRAVDPPSGTLVNANNRPAGQTYPYALARTWEEPYRARRIEALLAERMPHGLGAAAAMQRDTVSLAALDLVPALLERMAGHAPASEAGRTLLARLSAWDGTMERDRAEPLVYAAWTRALTRRLYAERLGPDFAAFWELRPRLLLTALAQGACGAAPNSCAEAVRASYEDALGEITARLGAEPARWRWGAVHAVELRHPVFGRIPVLGAWLGARLEMDGDGGTLNRSGMRFSDPADPYRAVHVASLRAIYDLADPGRSLFLIPTGQSGHPLSPRYLDLAARWRDFDYVRVPLSVEAARAGGGRVLRLVPAGG